MEIALYEGVEFPSRWEKIATLLPNVAGVDPTLFYHNGQWWLAYTDERQLPNVNLFLYYADQLTGPWRPHACNPVKTDIRVDVDDLVHTGPSTIAGRFLRTFWMPAYRSEDVPVGRAKPLRIMDEDLTLYRGESGSIHAVAFRCAHRGTQLNTGWVEGENIRCFYHGWVYDGAGRCVEQPAEPTPFCDRVRIRSYPVEDYLGVVFVYMGQGDPPPMQRFRTAEAATLRVVETAVYPFNFWNSLDNKRDYAHNAFVHQIEMLRNAAGDFAEMREIKIRRV